MDINIFDDNYSIEFTTADGKITVKRCGIFGLRFLFIDNIPTVQVTYDEMIKLKSMGENDIADIMKIYLE